MNDHGGQGGLLSPADAPEFAAEARHNIGLMDTVMGSTQIFLGKLMSADGIGY